MFWGMCGIITAFVWVLWAYSANYSNSRGRGVIFFLYSSQAAEQVTAWPVAGLYCGDSWICRLLGESCHPVASDSISWWTVWATNADTHSSTICNRQKLKRLKTPSRDFHEQNVRRSRNGICLMVRGTKWWPVAGSQWPLRALPGFTKTTQSMMSLRWNIQIKPLDKKEANKVPRTQGMFSEGTVTASTCTPSVQAVKKFY